MNLDFAGRVFLRGAVVVKTLNLPYVFFTWSRSCRTVLPYWRSSLFTGHPDFAGRVFLRGAVVVKRYYRIGDPLYLRDTLILPDVFFYVEP